MPSDAHPDVHDIVVNPQDPNKVYFATDGGLFRSDNFGATYYECTNGYTTAQFYIGSVSATDSTVMLAGAQDNFTSKYIGSNYWNPVIGGDGCFNAIDQTNDQIQYGSYQYLNVFSSNDQGNTFNNQILYYASSPLGGNQTGFLAPFVIAPSDAQRLYAGEQSLQRSDNQGLSFYTAGSSSLNNGAQILCIGVSATNADSLYYATIPDQSNSMKIFRSSNGGLTATDVTGANLPNRYPRRIAVNPSDSKTAYVVFSGFGSGHIFKTTNAGVTWTDVSTALPDLPFHCITIDPQDPNHVYAGCDFGIFYSADGGQTWTSWDTGLPDVTMIFDLVISPQGNELLAFTHGRGIYKRPLETISIGISEHSVKSSLQIYPNPCKNDFYITAEEENEALKVYDLNGKLCLTQKLIKGSNKISCSELQNGMYIASVNRKNKVYTARFIKS